MKTFKNDSWSKLGAALMTAAALGCAMQAAWADETDDLAFDEGTGVLRLSKTKAQEIEDYAGSSSLKLKSALADTKNLQPRDAFPVLVNKICSITQRSSVDAGGSELLFRVVLKQALELVYGVGQGAQCLPQPSPELSADLLGPGSSHRIRGQLVVFYNQLLRDSADLAMVLANTESQVYDRAQNRPVSVFDLPYADLGMYRLMAGQFWNQSAAFLGSRMEYTMLRALFRQWLKISTSNKVPGNLKFAALQKRTLDVIAETELGAPANSAPIGYVQRRARRLRRHMAEMLGELRPRLLPDQGFNPSRVSEITQEFNGRFEKHFAELEAATTASVPATQ